MDFVNDLFTSSISELSNLELAVGVVLLAVLGITVAFVLYRLMDKALEKSIQDEIKDWYENERWIEDQ